MLRIAKPLRKALNEKQKWKYAQAGNSISSCINPAVWPVEETRASGHAKAD